MRVLRVGVAVALITSALPMAVQAQDQQTLADVRQELTVLNVEVQKLKRELSTTGGPSVDVTGDSVLDRVAAIEAELQRLTAKSEELENRVNRVVSDGTNRIGDLEFRLVELEGGDVSQLGEATTLGGGPSAPVTATPVPADPATSSSGELAVGEEADFQIAAQALQEGNNSRAAELFAQFNQSYPGSPLAAQADLNRGRALAAAGDTREAARAYLASFSADSTGADAPVALYELGAALGQLGQTSQACLTLAEVAVRFPSSGMVSSAQQEMANLGCS
ncbi:tetratricopeptide repeat protein [Sedimentitalea todarodis]|uniref:Cell division coordinator CpoB n=1 Tax=Sedimentitalea todarodis TaxID=1631240 RepID=A0ABU3V8F2_9RHOB|nr:tetratricopeptide repeat protein [Sedimentitalea todarodis]MDU9002454.1 tetratricopeptide repeat protein [Sedimentitalea todarodis]